MLKKAMIYLMLMMTVCRFGAMVYMFAKGSAHLPKMIYLSTGMVVFLGVVLTAQLILGAISKRGLCAFFGVQAGVILFNLIYMKLFTFMEVYSLDFLIIGTLVEVVIGILLIVMNIRENRYIDVSGISKS